MEKVFLDTIGNHCIISCNSGINFYFNINDKTISKLEQCKDVVITSVAWNEKATEFNTKVFIFKYWGKTC